MFGDSKRARSTAPCICHTLRNTAEQHALCVFCDLERHAHTSPRLLAIGSSSQLANMTNSEFGGGNDAFVLCSNKHCHRLHVAGLRKHVAGLREVQPVLRRLQGVRGGAQQECQIPRLQGMQWKLRKTFLYKHQGSGQFVVENVSETVPNRNVRSRPARNAVEGTARF